MAEIKILIVEDEVINAKVLAHMLKKMGYSYNIAADGEIAVDMVKEFQYDLILMDVQMPVMDGLECTRKIREFEATLGRRTPIIGVTAAGYGEPQDKAMSVGMDAYIVKPVAQSMIETLIQRWLKL
jgi:CheY-like chemotaxis protein